MHALTYRKRSSSLPPGRKSGTGSRSDAEQGVQVKKLLAKPRAQARLKVGAPDDEYEREADRIADKVMRMPEAGQAADALSRTMSSGAPVDTLQRTCAPCAAEYRAAEDEERSVEPSHLCPKCRTDEEASLRTKSADGKTPEMTSAVAAGIQSLSGGGRPLPRSERRFFEPRFGADFSGVRLHDDSRAANVARKINARAFTLGRDIVFGTGGYSQGAPAGRKLLAHELTHVVQQQGGANSFCSASLDGNTVAGRWKIDNPNAVQVSGGDSNEDLLEAAFGEICNLTHVVNRGSDRVVEVQSGAAAANRREGCGCLQVIQNDHDAFVAGNLSFLRALPHIGLAVNGWSFTRANPANPEVQVRHPEDPFGWGYWTGGDQREQKGFFRTVAHEVCGHMSASVQGVPSGRGSGRGHNEAIIRENRIAGEHGVPVARQRGLDVDEGGVTAGVHRGESFLRAQVLFDHDSATPSDPAALTRVVNGVIGTIQFFATQLRQDRIRIQLEGFGLSNESMSVINQRMTNVRSEIQLAFGANSIADPFPDPDNPARNISRFARDVPRQLAGTSQPQTSNLDRRVDVYLFHRAHSAR